MIPGMASTSQKLRLEEPTDSDIKEQHDAGTTELPAGSCGVPQRSRAGTSSMSALGSAANANGGLAVMIPSPRRHLLTEFGQSAPQTPECLSRGLRSGTPEPPREIKVSCCCKTTAWTAESQRRHATANQEASHGALSC